jgi:Tfp pilus assembly protein PilV
MKHKNKISKGFTLMEVVLIMFIIAFVFTGVYNILARVFQHEKDSRYNLIAANLAQEGIEIVRNRRDENLLAEKFMKDGFFTGDCFPYWYGSKAKCDLNGDSEIRLDSDDIYRNCDSFGCKSSDEETPFTRVCNISGNNQKMTVVCTVKWKSPSLQKNKEVKIRSLLTNWQEN